MSKKIKVFVVGGDTDYANFLIEEYEIVSSIKESNIVIFTGGEDVHPMFYGENAGSKTFCNDGRDFDEIDMFEQARYYNILCVGICRGAQFLTTRAGGKLIQHVTGHGICGTHSIFISDENREVDITSTHHQMMYPFNLSNDLYKIIAHTKSNLSNTYLNGDDMEKFLPSNFVEPEIVYYYNINALCIQGHPEYMNKSSKAVKFINLLIDELIEDINKKNVDKEYRAEIIEPNPNNVFVINNNLQGNRDNDLDLLEFLGNDEFNEVV